MPSKKLITFVKNHLNKGYSLDEIRLHLVKQGYKTNQITQAINFHKKHHIPNHRLILLSIIIAIFAFIIVFSFLTWLNPVEEKTQEPINEQVQEQKTTLIPSTKEITKQEIITQEKAIQDIPLTEQVGITRDKEITMPEKLQQMKKPLPSETLYQTTFYTVGEIKTISTTDSQRAESLCIEHKSKDVCFNTIAKSTKNNNFCEKITDLFIKDNCLMFFVYAGENLCSKLTSKSLKNACPMIIQAKNTAYSLN